MADATIEPPRIFPTMRYADAGRMIDWLQQAFGFIVHARYGEGGRVDHAQLSFGSSMIMLGSDRDDAFCKIVGSPGQPGGKAIYVAVANVDAVHARAVAAGATIEEPPTDRDYGSREFICRDPEGNIWSFGTYYPKAHEKDG
ncbi:glyoxalase [Mesorhizobium sp. NBSH29]|uniref:VOC family protein n=1 Tax=Mesorhizobium sp. NBSH29 TaxID=2654249 RepID=UPI0018967730|nr:VOC family protein [Mesorhizobium sp. NBSH29]QPC88068.1 glyoxalase [Mesorhizobium sp. NBSH29]